MGAPRKNPPPNAAATIGKLASEGHAIIGIAKSLGVSRETFKRWLEHDETLQEAFDLGRETERQYLHSLIVQAAVLNKGANVNAFFILKARHGYREGDPQNVQVEVKVQNVLRVPDHGSDAEWATKAAEQQRRLSLGSEVPFAVAALPASVIVQGAAPEPIPASTTSSWMPPSVSPAQSASASPASSLSAYDPPEWGARP